MNTQSMFLFFIYSFPLDTYTFFMYGQELSLCCTLNRQSI